MRLEEEEQRDLVHHTLIWSCAWSLKQVRRKQSTIEQEKEQDLVFFNKIFFAKNEVRLEEERRSCPLLFLRGKLSSRTSRTCVRKELKRTSKWGKEESFRFECGHNQNWSWHIQAFWMCRVQIWVCPSSIKTRKTDECVRIRVGHNGRFEKKKHSKPKVLANVSG